VEASLKMYRSALLLTIALGVPSCGQSGTTRTDTQAAILKKWTLARCLSHSAEQTPTGDDAAKTAAAYLEMGNVGVDVYERLDALAERYLTRTYSGSVKSPYDTMKCIDLFESDELDRLARDSVSP
jgi:type VI secretion system (T6SS) amidase immunity protein Tai4